MGNTTVLRQVEVASLDELVGKSDFDFYPQELAERYHAEDQEIIRSEQGLYEHEGPTVDQGEERWVSTTKVPLRDPLGRVFGLVGMGRDITARKQSELALQRRALQLQTAAEVSRAASSVLDLDPLIQQAVDLIRERFELYYVGLFLVDEQGMTAIFPEAGPLADSIKWRDAAQPHTHIIRHLPGPSGTTRDGEGVFWQIQQAADAVRIYRYQYRGAGEAQGSGLRVPDASRARHLCAGGNSGEQKIARGHIYSKSCDH